MDCLKEIIGISENVCPCIEAKDFGELIKGGTFDDLNDWTVTGDWIADTNSAVSSNDLSSLSQTVYTESGITYELNFEYVGTENLLHLELNGLEYDVTVGTNTFTFRADSNSVLIEFINGNGSSTLSNVSFKMKDVSISGFYIDSKETQGIGLKGISDTRNCEAASEIWNITKDIREETVQEFTEMFHTVLNQRNTRKHSNQIFQIGDYKKATGALIVSQYPFAHLKPKRPYRGQVFNINSISIAFQSNYKGDIPWWIYANENLMYSGVAKMTGGRADINMKFELPTLDEFGRVQEYRIVYDRGTGFPIDYKWNCGCGSGYRTWQSEFRVNGGSVETFEDVTDTDGNLAQSVGMRLNANYSCDPLKFLCDLDYSLNYGYATVIAKTMQYIAWMRVAERIIHSDKINIWTLCRKEELKEKISKYGSEIKWRLNYLSDQYEQSYSDCFICADASGTHVIDTGS